MEAPRESPLPPRERDSLRARLLRETPRGYNPYVHLAIPSLFGVAVVTAAILLIDHLHPLELLTIPIVYLLSNAAEWRAHRDLLHRRSKLAPILYDRHTPQHHMLYTTDDMALRQIEEWRFVLIPPYGAILIFVGCSPIATALFALGLPNVAALFIASAVMYVVMYEWLHLSYHQPQESFVGRLGIVRFLRRHHAIHHDPRLMQRYNFNVTVPLWDLVRRTYVSERARDAGLAAAEPVPKA